MPILWFHFTVWTIKKYHGYFFGKPVEGMYAKASYTDCRGNEVTVDAKLTASGDFGVVTVNALAVADYDCAVTMTIYNADGSVYGSAVDSVAGYVARNTEPNDEAKLKALCEDLAKFAEAAYQYFQSL